MTILDTNTLIRFLTRDVPEQALFVKKLLSSNTQLHIPDVVFPEVEYVLERHYGIPRDTITQYYYAMIGKNNINVSPHIPLAVTIFEETTFDMADCIVAAVAISNDSDLKTFDLKLEKYVKNNPRQ